MTSKVIFTKLDKNHYNIFHHLLLGHREGTYENIEILNLLARFAPLSLLTAQDVNSQSPLDLAVSLNAEKLITAMEKLTKQTVVSTQYCKVD